MIHIEMNPADVWRVVAALQDVCRDPAEANVIKAQARVIGRRLQAAVAEIYPLTAAEMERGWPPE